MAQFIEMALESKSVIRFLMPEPPIDEKEIKEVEDGLKVSLPQDYRQHMLKINGGVVDPGSFDCKDGTSGCIGWLYSVLEADDWDIRRRAQVRRGRLPGGFVPIGYDGGGNEICIDCKIGPRYGKVYYWDHEMESDPSTGMTPEQAGNVHLVADSFTQFLECLRDPRSD